MFEILGLIGVALAGMMMVPVLRPTDEDDTEEPATEEDGEGLLAPLPLDQLDMLTEPSEDLDAQAGEPGITEVLSEGGRIEAAGPSQGDGGLVDADPVAPSGDTDAAPSDAKDDADTAFANSRSDAPVLGVERSDPGVAAGIRHDLSSNVAGTEADDILTGTEGTDFLYGAAGDDRLSGGDGNDWLNGNDGDDWIDGGDGDDWLAGHEGSDDLRGAEGRDTLVGGSGDDLLDGGAGDDALSGGAGDDVMTGGAGRDVLMGGDGNDLIRDDDVLGTLEVDYLNGGEGNDRIEAGIGDIVSGGNGLDIFALSPEFIPPVAGPTTIVDYRDDEDTLVLLYPYGEATPELSQSTTEDGTMIFADGTPVALLYGAPQIDLSRIEQVAS